MKLALFRVLYICFLGWSIDATGRIQTVFYLGSVFALIPFFLHVVFYLRWKRKHITTVQW